MLKAKTLQRLQHEKVGLPLAEMLKEHGFKYLKSKRKLVRESKDITETIGLGAVALNYDEDEEAFLISFTIEARVQYDAYNEWVNGYSNTSFRGHNGQAKNLAYYTYLSIEDFEADEMIQPSKARLFKQAVINSLAQREPMEPKDLLEDKDATRNELLQSVNELAQPESYLNSLAEGKNHIARGYFLIYQGKEAEGKAAIKQGYNEAVENFNYEHEKKYRFFESHLYNLYYLHKEVNHVLDETIDFLYQDDIDHIENKAITVVDSAQETLSLLYEDDYLECLRLNTLNFDYYGYGINSLGEVIIFYERDNVVKFNAKGEKVGEWTHLHMGSFGHKHKYHEVVLKGTDHFVLKNVLFLDDNTMLKLEIPEDDALGCEDAWFADLAYDQKTKRYVMLLRAAKPGHCFMAYYSLKGVLQDLKAIKIQGGYADRLIWEKQQIVVLDQNKQISQFIDLKGAIAGEYKFARSNHYYEISQNGNYLLHHFYSNQSQLYAVESGKKKTLWGHPTRIKGYKELLYSNVNHNFGLEACAISPDESYIVGGADHGKYVAWSLPKAERKELIPSQQLLNELHVGPDEYVDGVNVAKRVPPYLVELEGHEFLFNRGNGLFVIQFLEGGNFFTTLIGDSLAVWDRDFNNVNVLINKGRVIKHSEQYLSIKKGEELVFYRANKNKGQRVKFEYQKPEVRKLIQEVSKKASLKSAAPDTTEMKTSVNDKPSHTDEPLGPNEVKKEPGLIARILKKIFGS